MNRILIQIATLCFAAGGLFAQGLSCDYEANLLHEISLEQGSSTVRSLVDGNTLYLHQSDIGIWSRVDVAPDGSIGSLISVPSTDSGTELITRDYVFLYEPDSYQMSVYAQPAVRGDAPLSVVDFPYAGGNGMVGSFRDAIYSFDQASDFRITDISDPMNPVLLDPPGLPHNRFFLMHIIDEYEIGITHDFNGVIRTLDLSDELNPIILSERNTPLNNPREDIFYDGDTAYFPTSSGVGRYRFEADGSISELTPLTLQGMMHPATSVKVFGNRLWASTPNGSYAFLLNGTSEPTLFNYVHHVFHWHGDRSYRTSHISEVNGYTMFAEHIRRSQSPDQMKIKVYDTSSVIRQHPYAWFPPPGQQFEFHLYDDWVFRSRDALVMIYRFADQGASIEATASIPTSTVHHPTLLDDAFFAIDETADGSRVISIDLTTPDQPIVQPPVIFTGEVPESAFFTRQRMYATSEEGVSIYDLSQGPTAELIGHLKLAPNIAGATGIGLLNPSTLLVSWDELVLILDITDEQSPVIVGQIADPEGDDYYPYEIIPSPYSNLALIGWSPPSSQSNFPRPRLYEISDPSSPLLTPFHASYGRHTSARFSADTLTVSYAVSGIDIHDISDPLNPIRTNNINLPFAHFTDFAQLESGRLLTLTGVEASSSSNKEWVVYRLDDDCDFCALDYDLNRTVDISDVYSFIDHYYGTDPYADRNRDGRVNYFDIAAYIVEFQQGCD